MPAAEATSAIDDLELVAAAARAGGALALEFFGRDPEVWSKSNNSPVSAADLAVDKFLFERLRTARPDYGWLSEETEDDAERLGRRRVFVVDPIDGTRGFLAGSDEWTISIAVVEDGRPVAGALYRPVTGALYTASLGGGARRNGRLIQVTARETLAGATIAGPPVMLHKIRAHVAAMGEQMVEAGYIASLALRVALVADGALDLAVARKNSHDWDLAAADLILAEAGGRLIGSDGEELGYNRPKPVQPALIAAPPAVAALIWPLVRREAESHESSGDRAPRAH
ncbi:3'(2'),5'-bisphosphate nucleotidase CysQ [Methylobrevis albus]|uniref:3'(2'),5'-bisphosphate nucleotidase CysQ n=1 Tax=Methylobrevis albus TaxID=2793297 RepID=UPI001F4505B6|nr:3'(2'),5'-bisphosphate nucleotidase CysQ [Methylobrevis albus]